MKSFLAALLIAVLDFGPMDVVVFCIGFSASVFFVSLLRFFIDFPLLADRTSAFLIVCFVAAILQAFFYVHADWWEIVANLPARIRRLVRDGVIDDNRLLNIARFSECFSASVFYHSVYCFVLWAPDANKLCLAISVMFLAVAFDCLFESPVVRDAIVRPLDVIRELISK